MSPAHVARSGLRVVALEPRRAGHRLPGTHVSVIAGRRLGALSGRWPGPSRPPPWLRSLSGFWVAVINRSAGGGPARALGLGRGLGVAQAVRHLCRLLVGLSHQPRPVAAIDEEVVEGGAVRLGGIDRLDQRQLVAEALLRPARELEMVALPELAAGFEDADETVRPA